MVIKKIRALNFACGRPSRTGTVGTTQFNTFGYGINSKWVDQTTMTISQCIAVKILESIGSHLWGFKPNSMRHFVLEYGALESVVFFAKYMPKYERILRKWGPIRTHIVSTALSTLQGCEYCIHGHAYALQLQYFKQTNTLFPLDESALAELHALPDKEILKHFSDALIEVDLAGEIDLLNKINVLREQAPSGPQSQEDEYLLHLMDMFSMLNSCGIKYQVVPDGAHDPINKDKQLREHYAAVRSI